MRREPIYLAGPTAVGKTAVSLLLAEISGAEIISVDSMQVYRGMDVGTAKPSISERQRVQHHLLDVANPAEEFDLSRFYELAMAAQRDIESRGKRALFCGGTGLYFNALVRGLDLAPPSNPALRQELEATPLELMLQELQQGDPVTYERIDHHNPRRIIRALQMLRSGSKPSEVRKTRAPARAEHLFVLTREIPELHRRIEERVDVMFAQGLVKETEDLLARGLRQNRNAMQALGYRQVIEHLEGLHSLAETVALVKLRTRQFARRQLTWFRGQFQAQWWQVEPGESPAAMAERIYARIKDVEKLK